MLRAYDMLFSIALRVFWKKNALNYESCVVDARGRYAQMKISYESKR